MRVNELQAPQKARDVARTAGASWAKLQGQEQSALSKLEKHGFKLLGEPGAGGSVYEKEGYPYVLKVFNDPAYMEWFNYCKSNQDNPYVPKIKGGLVRLGTARGNMPVFGIRLEYLEYKGQMVQKICSDELFDLVKSGADHIEPMTYEFLVDNPQLFEVIDAINELRESGFSLDLHSKNIMWRGDQLVIIDPIT